MFPQQLQKEDYRFILLKPKSKIPFENDWQNTNNYRYDDNKLIQHINKEKILLLQIMDLLKTM